MPLLERRKMQILGRSSLAAIVPPRAAVLMGVRPGSQLVIGEASGLLVIGPTSAERRILSLLAELEARR